MTSPCSLVILQMNVLREGRRGIRAISLVVQVGGGREGEKEVRGAEEEKEEIEFVVERRSHGGRVSNCIFSKDSL